MNVFSDDVLRPKSAVANNVEVYRAKGFDFMNEALCFQKRRARAK
jgi:hypothetical protein